jgi:Holliday junction resolvase
MTRPGRTGSGIPAERRVKARLEADGYVVTRSPGSLGPADLIAIKLGQVLFIQVKSGDGDAPGAHRETWWNGLWSRSVQAGAEPIIADWVPPPGKVRPVLRYRRVTGPHVPGARDYDRLTEPFYPDAVMAPDGRRPALTCARCGAAVTP